MNSCTYCTEVINKRPVKIIDAYIEWTKPIAMRSVNESINEE